VPVLLVGLGWVVQSRMVVRVLVHEVVLRVTIYRSKVTPGRCLSVPMQVWFIRRARRARYAMRLLVATVGRYYQVVWLVPLYWRCWWTTGSKLRRWIEDLIIIQHRTDVLRMIAYAICDLVNWSGPDLRLPSWVHERLLKFQWILAYRNGHRPRLGLKGDMRTTVRRRPVIERWWFEDNALVVAFAVPFAFDAVTAYRPLLATFDPTASKNIRVSPYSRLYLSRIHCSLGNRYSSE
jgi:hypothetical protein